MNEWPKYWSFSFSISPSNKYSGLRKALNSLTEIPVPHDWLIPYADGTNSLAKIMYTQTSLATSSELLLDLPERLNPGLQSSVRP